jgi:hypothetical protein
VKAQSFEVIFPIPYARTPQIDVSKFGEDATSWSCDVMKQTAESFTVRFTNGVLGIESDDNFIEWRAMGLPDVNADPRSRWTRLSIAERLFAVATVVGAVASVWQFGEMVWGLVKR